MSSQRIRSALGLYRLGFLPESKGDAQASVTCPTKPFLRAEELVLAGFYGIDTPLLNTGAIWQCKLFTYTATSADLVDLNHRGRLKHPCI